MKLFNENGHLNEYGKQCLDMFLGKELSTLMNSADTVQELQTLKAVLTKYVGDKLADRMNKVRGNERV